MLLAYAIIVSTATTLMATGCWIPALALVALGAWMAVSAAVDIRNRPPTERRRYERRRLAR
jgi:hypothetical protein